MKAMKRLLAVLLAVALAVPSVKMNTLASEDATGDTGFIEIEDDAELQCAEDLIANYDKWQYQILTEGVEDSVDALYATLRSLEEPVYSELGYALLGGIPIKNVSSSMAAYFNSDLQELFLEAPKTFYKVILLQYFMYSAGNDATINEESTFKTVVQAYLKSLLGEDFSELSVDEAAELLVSEELTALCSADWPLAYSVEAAKGYVETADELLEAVSVSIAKAQVATYRFLILEKISSLCTLLNSDMAEAAQELYDMLPGIGDLGSGNAPELAVYCSYIWADLCKDYPSLASIQSLDDCFATADGANELKLKFLYSVDNFIEYSMTEMRSAAKTDESSQKLYVLFFQAYMIFQMYAMDYVNTWLAEYVEAGNSSEVIAEIYAKAGISSVEELLVYCNKQKEQRMELLLLLNRIAADETLAIRGTCGDSLTWTYYQDGLLKISGTGVMYDYNETEAPWSAVKSMIQSVVIPHGVTAIGEKAFDGCTALSKITIFPSVTAIGEFSFNNVPDSMVVYSAAGSYAETYAEAHGYTFVAYDVCGGSHSYKETVKEATCTEGGYKLHTCEVCAVSYKSEEQEALGHDNVTLAAKEPTCTADGYTSKHYCARCEEVFTASETVPMLGHSFVDYVSNEDATCTEDGTKTAQCSRCEATDTIVDEGSALGHTPVTEEGVEATCTKPGYTSVTYCEICEEVFEASETVPALGHNFGEYVSNEDADCLEDGTKTAQCSRCDATDTVIDAGSALGHDEASRGGMDPTCEEEGYTDETYCKRCEEVITESEIIPVLGHDFTEENYVSDGNVTCTEAGTETAKCSRCDATDTRTVEPLGHDEAVEEGKEASCTEEGYTARTYCLRCEMDIIPSEGIPAKGHKEVVEKGEAATCTEDGVTDRITCEECLEVLQDHQVIPAHGHEAYEYTHHQDATCTTNRVEKGSCLHCGMEMFLEVEDSALGHVIVNVEAIAPTCTEAGRFAGQYCSRCDEVLSGLGIDPPKGHNMSEYVSDENATCTEDGTKTSTCVWCNEKKDTVTDEGSALGHQITIVVGRPATCMRTGNTDLIYCTRCNETLQEKTTIPITDHSYGDWTITTAATYSSYGEKERECIYGCGTIEYETIPKVTPTSITLNKTTAAMVEGNTLALTATCAPIPAKSGEVVWTSDDTSVATVNRSSGLVTAVSAGTVRITATLGTLSKSCVVTVVDTNLAAPTISANLTGANDISVTMRGVSGASGYYLYSKVGTGSWSVQQITGANSIFNIAFSNLSYNTTHYFKAVAYKTVNGVKYTSSNASSVVSLKTAPELAKPASVTVSLTGINDVRVSWTRVNNATGYYVYRKTASQTEYSYAGQTANLYYSFADLNASTRYYFKVVPYVSVNGVNYKAEQGTISYITTPVSLARTTVSSRLNGLRNVRLTWSRVANATGYNIYRNNTWVASTTNLYKQFDGLYFGTQYTFKVVPYILVNGQKLEGERVATSTITTLPSLAAPSNLSASRVSYNAVRLSWSGVRNATGYYVYYSTSQSGSYQYYTSVTSTSATISNLTAGRTYYFKVLPYRYYNSMQMSGSLSSIRSFQLTGLTAPVSVRTQFVGYNTVKVTWTGVANASGYRVYYGTNRYSLVRASDGTTGTQMTFYGLNANRTYYFKVVPYVTVNGTKYETSANRMTSITTMKSLAAPGSLTLRAVSRSQIRATWNRVANASGYYVYYGTSAGNLRYYGRVTGTSVSITGLSRNTRYYIKVVPYLVNNGTRYTAGSYSMKNIKTKFW